MALGGKVNVDVSSYLGVDAASSSTTPRAEVATAEADPSAVTGAPMTVDQMKSNIYHMQMKGVIKGAYVQYRLATWQVTCVTEEHVSLADPNCQLKQSVGLRSLVRAPVQIKCSDATKGLRGNTQFNKQTHHPCVLRLPSQNLDIIIVQGLAAQAMLQVASTYVDIIKDICILKTPNEMYLTGHRFQSLTRACVCTIAVCAVACTRLASALLR